MTSSANTNNGEAEAAAAEEKDQHFSYAMQLVTLGYLPMVLHTAFRLGVFEIIGKHGPAKVTASQIVSHLPTKNPNAVSMLDRMLRLLASHSILTCSVDDDGFTRAYGLAPVAKYFVGNPDMDGASVGPLMELTRHKAICDSGDELEGAILEGGIPFNRVHGIHIFEYPGRDPQFNEVFNQAMINNTTLVMSRILDSYNGFELLKSLVDVGGGLGIAISKITAKYPAIKGINFDLPHVIQHAPAYSGVEHIGGDMFASVPCGGAILLKYILHDWDDDQCVELLKRCYASLPDDGKVIVIEAVLPVLPNPSSSVKQNCQLDLVMMMYSNGGKERSEQEFLALATAAGFRGIKKKCFVCSLWVMEFYK